MYGRSSDQKESPVDWTPHEDVTRQATEAGSLLPTVFWSEKERAPSSPLQGYHQEKPEAERHKDRLLDITLERSGSGVELRTLDYENPGSNPGCGVKTLGKLFHSTLLQFTQLFK